MTWSICISAWKSAFRHRWFRWIVTRHFTVTCFPISTLGEHGDTWHSYCRMRSSVQLCKLTMSFRGQNNRTILPLTLSTSYCFCLIPWPWKHGFCHLIGQFWSCIYRVMPETEFRMMAELICKLWAKYLWLNQFLIAFIVFLDHENIGFVALFIRFGHVLAELCLKNEFCIMAELICILCKMLKGARMASSGFLI